LQCNVLASGWIEFVAVVSNLRDRNEVERLKLLPRDAFENFLDMHASQ
jgi:hypothetical protein